MLCDCKTLNKTSFDSRQTIFTGLFSLLFFALHYFFFFRPQFRNTHTQHKHTHARTINEKNSLFPLLDLVDCLWCTCDAIHHDFLYRDQKTHNSSASMLCVKNLYVCWTLWLSKKEIKKNLFHYYCYVILL